MATPPTPIPVSRGLTSSPLVRIMDYFDEGRGIDHSLRKVRALKRLDVSHVYAVVFQSLAVGEENTRTRRIYSDGLSLVYGSFFKTLIYLAPEREVMAFNN